MLEINQIAKLEDLLANQDLKIIYGSADNCSVCQSVLPRVQTLADHYRVPLYLVNSSQFPAARGLLSLFTAPVIMVYYEAREYHRQARFIDFDELDYRLSQLASLTKAGYSI